MREILCSSSANGASSPPTLELRHVAVTYGQGANAVSVVHDVSFKVERGEALGIVGESGCGKSQTMLAALRLLPRGGRVSHGEVLFEGHNVLALAPGDLRLLRGKGIALISQDAHSALNPSMNVGRQMAEPMIRYGMSRNSARRRCVELLDLVGIPGAAGRLSSYPYELSGGMCQRVLIAMAVSANPKVLIADEPTSGLDLTIQSQVLRLIDRLRRHLGMALILITHDLGVLSGVVDTVAVMYVGRIVETAPTEALFKAPRHPYTRALLAAIPKMEGIIPERLASIPGLPPDPLSPVQGCAFHPRCCFAQQTCARELPPLEQKGVDHSVRCWVDPWKLDTRLDALA